MINSKTPVYTYAIGMAMSMGLEIFTAGHKRFVYKNTTLMYHELSSFNWDKLTGIKLDMLQLEVLQKKYLIK
jgi:ATP-dependent protease ClpP protease subunit